MRVGLEVWLLSGDGDTAAVLSVQQEGGERKRRRRKGVMVIVMVGGSFNHNIMSTLQFVQQVSNWWEFDPLYVHLLKLSYIQSPAYRIHCTD